MVERYLDFKQSWRTRKEKTCTYREHIGQFKAIMRNDFFSWMFFQCSEIPESSGYSPNRYRECTDLMVLKKAQVYNIEKQRAIGILETEFNHSNRSLGREAMNLALQLNKVAPEQLCRPGSSALDQSILKRLCFDHQRYIR